MLGLGGLFDRRSCESGTRPAHSFDFALSYAHRSICMAVDIRPAQTEGCCQTVLTSAYFQKQGHAAAAQPSQERLRVNTSPGRHWGQYTMSPPACLPQQVMWNLRGVKPQSGGGAAATSSHAVTGMKLACACASSGS